MKADKKVMTKKLEQFDKDTCDLVIKDGVLPNSTQMLRWIIDSDDKAKSNLLTQKLKKILPGVRFFSNYNLEVVLESEKSSLIVVETPDFIFTIQNVIKFSRVLWELAEKSGCEYNLWLIDCPVTEKN